MQIVSYIIFNFLTRKNEELHNSMETLLTFCLFGAFAFGQKTLTHSVWHLKTHPATVLEIDVVYLTLTRV